MKSIVSAILHITTIRSDEKVCEGNGKVSGNSTPLVSWSVLVLRLILNIFRGHGLSQIILIAQIRFFLGCQTIERFALLTSITASLSKKHTLTVMDSLPKTQQDHPDRPDQILPRLPDNREIC